jgi:hypothetical protein
MLVSRAQKCRAPLASSSWLLTDPRSVPAAAVFEPADADRQQQKQQRQSTAEWDFGGRNSFFCSSSSSCWWCSRDNPSAGHGCGARLPVRSYSKSQSPPGLPGQVVPGCRGAGEGAGKGCKERVGHGGEGWGRGGASKQHRRSGSGCLGVLGEEAAAVQAALVAAAAAAPGCSGCSSSGSGSGGGGGGGGGDGDGGGGGGSGSSGSSSKHQTQGQAQRGGGPAPTLARDRHRPPTNGNAPAH